jgi:NADH-quinone oxidoreductase subunit H
MVAQSVLLLVVLLVVIAYVLLADRKSGRRCRSAAGRTWSARSSCCNRSPTDQVRGQEPIIPSGSNKGVFLLAPLVAAVLAPRPGR